jgi:hypothetical protein
VNCLGVTDHGGFYLVMNILGREKMTGFTLKDWSLRKKQKLNSFTIGSGMTSDKGVVSSRRRLFGSSKI